MREQRESRHAGRRRGHPRALAVPLVVLLAVLSLVPRLLHLDAPLLERDAHRQTHTAIIVRNFVEEGISPLHYLTPIFGPPWQIPFEFPLFQMTAAGITALGVGNVDVACRLANIAYFYLSAVFLYFLSCAAFQSRSPAACVLLFYLWCPFNISRSRTAMIDFASLACALGYWFFYQRWLGYDGAGERRSLMAAYLFGVLGYLTKITTMATVVVALGYSVWRDVSRRWVAGRASGSTFNQWLRTQRNRLLAMGSVLVIPALIGVFWAVHANAIANASAVTAGIGRHRAWLFGPLSERFDAAHWIPILSCLGTDVFPGFLAILPIAAVRFTLQTSRRGQEFIAAALLGGIVAVLTFFNLYSQHDYYLMAVAPAFSIVGGVGLYSLARLRTPRSAVLGIALLLLCAFSATSRLGTLIRTELTADDPDQLVQLGKFVRDHTRPDEYVVVTDYDWNPSILYYAERRGLMLPGWMENNPVRYAAAIDLLRRAHFTTVVCTRVRPALFANWRRNEQIGTLGRFKVYRVWDE